MDQNGTVTCQWIIYKGIKYRTGEHIPIDVVQQIHQNDFAASNLKHLGPKSAIDIDQCEYIGCFIQIKNESLKALLKSLK